MPADHTLLLLRHAKSYWDSDLDDAERPLNDRGRREAKTIGAILSERGWRPDLVLCSPAVRARQTWSGAVEGGAAAGEVRVEESIYAAAPDTLQGLIRRTPESVGTLALVGHAPGLPELAERLTAGVESPAAERMREKYSTAGLAVLGLTGPWADLSRADLVDFLAARG
jgi:phosphohistidine phosphatase